MTEKNMLTTSEVAEKLGVTRWRINAMIRDGRIKAERYGQIWLIDEKELRSVEDRKPGRPPKPTSDKPAKAKKASK